MPKYIKTHTSVLIAWSLPTCFIVLYIQGVSVKVVLRPLLLLVWVNSRFWWPKRKLRFPSFQWYHKNKLKWDICEIIHIFVLHSHSNSPFQVYDLLLSQRSDAVERKRQMEGKSLKDSFCHNFVIFQATEGWDHSKWRERRAFPDATIFVNIYYFSTSTFPVFFILFSFIPLVGARSLQ